MLERLNGNWRGWRGDGYRIALRDWAPGVRERQALQRFTLNRKSHGRTLLEGRMNATIRDVAQPQANLAVRQDGVDQFASSRLQRVKERFPQVAVKSLNLPFRLGTVRRAQFDVDTIVLREVAQRAVVLMEPIALGVALDDDRLGIVTYNVRRSSAEELQRALEARNQRLAPLVVGEFHVRVARVSQLRRERAQRRWTAPKDDEVDL